MRQIFQQKNRLHSNQIPIRRKEVHNRGYCGHRSNWLPTRNPMPLILLFYHLFHVPFSIYGNISPLRGAKTSLRVPMHTSLNRRFSVFCSSSYPQGALTEYRASTLPTRNASFNLLSYILSLTRYIKPSFWRTFKIARPRHPIFYRFVSIFSLPFHCRYPSYSQRECLVSRYPSRQNLFEVLSL